MWSLSVDLMSERHSNMGKNKTNEIYGRVAFMFIRLITAIRFRMGRGALDFRCN